MKGYRSLDKFFLSMLLLLTMTTSVFSTTTKEVFAKFPNYYFIETGSFKGEGIQNALDAGFERILSIEYSSYYFLLCRKKFSQNSKVHIFLGDSTHLLKSVLKGIDAPATFWLDGHYTKEKYSAKGRKNSPIMEELATIKMHPIKTHTILIDDVRLFGTIHFDFTTLEQIVERLLEINPNYKISFEDGFVPNDVLVATLESA